MANSVIINHLLQKLRYSINEFEQKIEVKPGRIYKAIQRETNISDEVVMKIITHFPKVRKEWLQEGTGDMFIDEEKKKKKIPFRQGPEAGRRAY